MAEIIERLLRINLFTVWKPLNQFFSLGLLKYFQHFILSTFEKFKKTYLTSLLFIIRFKQSEDQQQKIFHICEIVTSIFVL